MFLYQIKSVGLGMLNSDELSRLLSKEPNQFMIDVDEDVYRKSEAIAQSDLKVIKSKSLYHYKNQPAQKSTPAQILGSAIHTLIFEPGLFEERFLIIPKDLNRRTKAGKEEFSRLLDLNKGLLSSDEMATCKRLKSSIKRQRHVAELIEGCLFEKSCFVQDESGLLLKCRLDGYHEDCNSIVDLKTTLDASPGSFERDIFKYGYHFQGAYYTDIVHELTGEYPTFKIIALEKSYPFEAAVYELSTKTLAIGRTSYREQLALLKGARENDRWPGYAKVTTVTPPKWLDKDFG